MPTLPDSIRSIPHRENISFGRLTTLGVGGQCKILFEPTHENQVCTLVKTFRQEGWSYRILGGGSNLVVLSDIEEPVIRLNFPKVLKVEGREITAPANFGHIRLSQAAAEQGLSGMEYAAGIPGTTGGALHMNAGAYGRELVQILSSYRYIHPEGEVIETAPRPENFGYRRSHLGPGYVALGFTIRLTPGDSKTIQAEVESNRLKRGSSQPLSKRNAGCIFKNPPGESAGRLIDRAGLKGYRVGDAEVSPEHANFLINHGQATARDFYELMIEVQSKVQLRYGITLEPEVEVWGNVN
jgi:UDP-N-acetylmuramate dehydrogenase